MNGIRQYIVWATAVMGIAAVMWGTAAAENRITKLRTGEAWEEVFFSTGHRITETGGHVVMDTERIINGGERALSLSPPPWNYVYWMGVSLWQAVTEKHWENADDASLTVNSPLGDGE